MTFPGYCKCEHHYDRHGDDDLHRGLSLCSPGAVPSLSCKATILTKYDGQDTIVECPCVEFSPAYQVQESSK